MRDEPLNPTKKACWDKAEEALAVASAATSTLLVSPEVAIPGPIAALAGATTNSVNALAAFTTTAIGQRVVLVVTLDVANTVAFESSDIRIRIDGVDVGAAFQFSAVLVAAPESKQMVVTFSIAAPGPHDVGLSVTAGATGNVTVTGPIAGTSPSVFVMGAI